MNSADYAAGCAALALTVVPWIFASRRIGRRVLPEWNGAAGALVAAVVGLSGILVVAELLGMTGFFSRWLMAGTSAVVALAAAVVAGRTVPPAAERVASAAAGRSRTQLAALALAGFSVLAVSAALLGRDARTLHTGPDDVDALHYHLTESAYFVQSHSLDHLRETGASDPSGYYPLDDELLNAVAMLGPRPDIAVLPLNLGFAWLALLGCWVLGARWQMATAAVAAGAAVLSVPLISGVSSGAGLNDIPAVAALLAAAGIAAHAGRLRASWLPASAVVGLALGLAAGSKLPLLAPVVFLALAVVRIAPARRAGTVVVLAATAFVTGGFWYVRDWIAVGTPVPDLNLTVAGHGLHGVPYPLFRPYSYSVAHYLTDGSVIRHQFVPQLKEFFTPLWPVVAVLALAGVIQALVRAGDPLRRMLSVTAIAGTAVYVVTPTTALGPLGRPLLFGVNLRYAIPVIALSVLLAATAEPLRRFLVPVTAFFAVMTVALLDSSTVSHFIDRSTGWAAATLAAATAAWVTVVLRRRPSLALKAAITVIAVLVAAGGGDVLQRHYLRDRYSAPDPLDRLFAWGETVHGQRIGVAGYPLMYPFFGPNFDNQVSYVGVTASDRSFDVPNSCAGWRAALAAGRFNYVVIEDYSLEPTSRFIAWTVSLPGARLVASDGRRLHNSKGTVLALPQIVTDRGCQPPTAG